MLVARLITRLFLSVGYPCFAPLSGQYQVGAIQTRLPNSVACQIHYPADPSTRRDEFVPYWRQEAVDGLADYSKTNPTVLQLLSRRKHPCLMNAEPIAGERFPLVLFSHGLGGSMEMYTQLCQQIASHGFVVVAMEHEDGSGAYAETPLGNPILYKRPDDTPYSRQKVLDFRDPFLQQRVDETTSALDALLNKAGTTSPQVQNIVDAIDRSKGISLVGHSFGGATVALAAQKYLSEGASFVPTSVSLLDVWAFSMEDEALNQGIPLPTLSILSEGWLTNPERAQVNQLLHNCPDVLSFFVPQSVHPSFSDAVNWLPRFIGKKMRLQGRKEKAYDTIPAAARACVQHIQSSLNAEDDGMVPPIGTSDSLQPYKYAYGQSKKKNAAVSVSS